ncbi:hypothetical protein KAR48_12075 [bacterium]|nr:hypothetical protein [bacterium]
MESSSPYQEILAVLEAGMTCAQSLRAGAQDADKLLEIGQIDQAQARYNSREEVLAMIVGLNGRLVDLMNGARPSLSGKEWGHLVEMSSRLRDVLSETTSLDALNIKSIDVQCQKLIVDINHLKQGKHAVKSYQAPQRSKAEYKA